MTFAIQTRLASVLAGGALAACLAAPAHADVTKYLSLTLGSGTTQSASFSDIVGSVGSFTDDYVFASPPPVSFATITGTAGAGITFTSVSLLTYGVLTTNPLTGTFSAGTFTESASPALQSAVYVLEIKGIATTVTASYTGSVTAVPVPEPASWAMLLAGLAATGLSLRRRRQPMRSAA